MSDTSETETTTTASDTDSGGEKNFTQADVDRIIGERLAREKANLQKQYEGYDQLKADSKELQKLRNAAKTETEKLADRISELETALAEKDSILVEKEREVQRRDIAKDKGVPVGLVTGSTREEMEASADAALEWRGTPVKKPITGFQSGASAPTGANEKEKAAAAIRAMRRGA